MIAINYGDSRKEILDYARKSGFTFKMAMGEKQGKNTVFSRYGVQAYPTNYLLNGKGKIVFRSVGFDEAGLKAALIKMGIK